MKTIVALLISLSVNAQEISCTANEVNMTDKEYAEHVNEVKRQRRDNKIFKIKILEMIEDLNQDTKDLK